jgi:hypothetical protein
MTSYRNAADDLDCESVGTTVFIGNVGLSDFQEPRADLPNPATAILSIDVISAPGSQAWTFHFVTLLLQIEAPAEALFVHHSGRGNYHREVPSDPTPEFGGEPAGAYWVESNEPAPTVRIREDATALLSGDGNGRTYYIGVAGAGSDLGALRFAASAEASLVRESSCHLVIGDMHVGDRIAGYLD